MLGIAEGCAHGINFVVREKADEKPNGKNENGGKLHSEDVERVFGGEWDHRLFSFLLFFMRIFLRFRAYEYQSVSFINI